MVGWRPYCGSVKLLLLLYFRSKVFLFGQWAASDSQYAYRLQQVVVKSNGPVWGHQISSFSESNPITSNKKSESYTLYGFSWHNSRYVCNFVNVHVCADIGGRDAGRCVSTRTRSEWSAGRIWPGGLPGRAGVNGSVYTSAAGWNGWPAVSGVL